MCSGTLGLLLDMSEFNISSRRYPHDCSQCVFLGLYQEYDLYYCPQIGLPTVLARYGHEGHEYYSGLGLSMQPLIEAQSRAIDRGLLKPKVVNPGVYVPPEKGDS